MAPLSGIVEMYGAEIANAAFVAADEVNRSGGLLGRPLELCIADDGSLPESAVTAAYELAHEQGCCALVGNLLSSSRIEVADHVARVLHVPYLNFSFYEGGISSRYFFHFAALPNQQIDPMISAMMRLHGPRIFFAGNDYEWPRGSIEACKERLAALDGETLGEEYLPFNASSSDIDEVLARLAQSGANVFVPYFAGHDQIAVLKRFAALGLRSRMAVAMGHFDEAMALQLEPSEREGLYSCNTYFMSVASPESRTLLRRLGSGADGMRDWPNGSPILTNFGEAAYICVKAFSEAVRKAGSLDVPGILHELSHAKVKAPQGEVRMDPATNHAWVNSFLSKCHGNGRFEIVESFGQIEPRIPDRYLKNPSVADVAVRSPTADTGGKPSALPGNGIARQQLSDFFNVADVALIAANEAGVITDVSPRAAEMFGFSDVELIGRSVHILVPPSFRQRHAAHFHQFAVSEDVERRMGRRAQVTGYRKDGTYFPVEASIAKYRDGDRWRLVVTFRDVTAERKAAADLIYRSTHDLLTGLPNRGLIMDRIGKALARSQRNGLNIALMFVDLDGFKSINDRFGHAAGDEVLRESAARLANAIRPGDTVGRLAGDEFLVLCELIETPEAVSSVAERLVEILAQPVKFGIETFSVTASVGVAIGSSSTHSPEELIRAADTAMYSVKRSGRAGWRFFNPDLQREAEQRLTLSVGLRSAIERDELHLLFQPIVHCETGAIKGAEALLRWEANGRSVSPAQFIPVAEANGSIVPIGYWVFEQACRVARQWREELGDEAPYVSINVSTRQLAERRLVEQIREIIKKTGARPESLLVEITETSLMADVTSAGEVLRQISELGIKIAVDDFGTGYSSLAQLQRLRADVLKIDKEFVQGIDRDFGSRVVVDAICRIGRSLDMRLIAEGVETQEQRSAMQLLGCDGIQGYLFHRPLSSDSVLRECQASLLRGAQSGELRFLVYVSEIARPFDDLEQLVAQAGEANRSSGITGHLFLSGSTFVQYLEGPAVQLAKLYDKIQRDSRHQNVQRIAEGPLERRLFRAWSMGFHDLNRSRLASHALVGLPQTDKSGFKENPGLCLAMFEVLASSQ